MGGVMKDADSDAIRQTHLLAKKRENQERLFFESQDSLAPFHRREKSYKSNLALTAHENEPVLPRRIHPAEITHKPKQECEILSMKNFSQTNSAGQMVRINET
jgi:hypothetical protein